ncbi:MAG: phosphatase PAP2 family protein [Alistipes shahii]|uniref:phosphatase PAP2 family protein n=2 Tax=Alistipes shahii TaxID=328814 RepID=UPI003990ACAF
MLKRLTAACLLSFAGLGAAAQLPDSADMSAGGEFRRRIDRHTSTKAYRMLFVGTPLIVGGVVMQAYDSDFRRLRNGYSRSFRHDYDDWLQYAPAGAMVALKACGVRGRSSWGRMLVSDAFSAGLMAIGVNSLKYSCRVMRPDGSSRNSFPSGHTATAFMAATMLHKEYGHRSPWYSIGGYTVATITGVTRQLNNRHWMSDIMVGAGIGILATELGYFLADLIFKEKGLNVTETYSVYDRCRRPSFLGFSLGFSTVPGSYTPYPGMHMQFLSGPAVSVQGAWFATPYWGFGGRMSCTNLRVKVNGVAQNDNLECASMYAGPYFPTPFRCGGSWAPNCSEGARSTNRAARISAGWKDAPDSPSEPGFRPLTSPRKTSACASRPITTSHLPWCVRRANGFTSSPSAWRSARYSETQRADPWVRPLRFLSGPLQERLPLRGAAQPPGRDAVLQRAEPQFPLRHFFNRIAAVPRRTVGIGPRKHLPGRRIADKGVGPGEPGVPERPDTLVKGECPVFAELQVNRSGQGRTVLPAGQHPAVVVRLVLTAALVSAAADSQQSRGRHGKKAQSDFHTQGRPAPGFRKDGLQI